MRHPPRSVLLPAAGAVALPASAVVPAVSAQGATPARTVEYAVTGQWADGFQGLVRITNDQAATAESRNGALGTGASVSAGFLGSRSGGTAVPAVFKLNGTTCDTGSEPTAPPPAEPPTGGTAPALRVSGTKLVDTAGTPRRLLGVNRSGGEFTCVQGHGVWDGPVEDAAVAAIAGWKANAVRIPLNEECWLGLSDITPEYAGAAYIAAVKDLVARVEAHGMTPVPEMHWSHGRYTGNSAGRSDAHATSQKPMPDLRYGPAFRASVADTFTDDRAAVSDAGVRDLVDAVRGAGAKNVISAGGPAYSNDLSQWNTYRPADPAGNLAAAYHGHNVNSRANESCWNPTLAPVAARVPLVAGEIGENTCSHACTDQVMKWSDDHGLSCLGWTWNTWDRSLGPSLIAAYDGTPTAYGAGPRDHLRAVNR